MFFQASEDYTVVFTANATAALKLVGESYPFTAKSSLVLGTDSHNSVCAHLGLTTLCVLIPYRFMVFVSLPLTKGLEPTTSPPHVLAVWM